jgi:hypothetical protein
MNQKVILSLLAASVLICFQLAEAQQPKKVPRIGYLSPSDAATGSALIEGIRLALRELGYIEGHNIIIEYRYAEGKWDRLPELAAELVRLKVDTILVGGPPLVRAAMNATQTIPIVMWGAGTDPVEEGLVKSLARPGGNRPHKPWPRTRRCSKKLFPNLPVSRLSCHSGQCRRGETGSPSRSASATVDYSVLGGTRHGRFRQGIRCATQGAPGWTLRDRRGPANEF